MKCNTQFKAGELSQFLMVHAGEADGSLCGRDLMKCSASGCQKSRGCNAQMNRSGLLCTFQPSKAAIHLCTPFGYQASQETHSGTSGSSSAAFVSMPLILACWAYLHGGGEVKRSL